MKQVGLPYSGDYGFVETVMYWPVNHMVAPKDQSVSCAECHTRDADGRLANLAGFYMPGRNYNKPLELLGMIAIWLSLGAVLVHALVRIVMPRKK